MIIGHASIDENKKTKNGKAGDQTGKEVCTRTWYSKPWDLLLRCKDSTKAELMAQACEKGCANPHIGYDQNQRNTLRTQAKSVNWDLSRIVVDCETDCSAFMTVCAESSGIKFDYVNAPTTSTMKNAFIRTGMFDVLIDKKYLTSDQYLKRGDILVKQGSHTVMVLGNGPQASVPSNSTKYPDLFFGQHNQFVLNWQLYLSQLGFYNDSIDGIFGKNTEAAVKAYQAAKGLPIDGKITLDDWASVGR